MIAKLTKPVTRELAQQKTYRGKSRAVIATLEPGDMIAFRLAGGRMVWRWPLAKVFWSAQTTAPTTTNPTKGTM